MRIGLKSVAQSSSSSQKSHIVPKPFVKQTVQDSPPWDGRGVQAEDTRGEPSSPPRDVRLEETSRNSPSGACLDSVNLFNPPKSNPNGRLASSRLFNKHIPPKKALSPRGVRSGNGARTEHSTVRVTKDKSHKPPVEGSLYYQKSGFTPIRFNRKLPSRPASPAFARRGTSDQKSQETSREILNSWRISAIAIILLANTISAIVILRDKFPTPLVAQESLVHSLEKEETMGVGGAISSSFPKNSYEASSVRGELASKRIQRSETTPEILAGKTNLAVQEFITPDLNSLSHISLTSQDNKTVEQDIKSERSLLPLAIPPTNLPHQEIISSRTVDNSYYYVLTEYTGEQSLRLAQKQVKSVSLVNFPQGIFIYLGAFSDKTLAQQFVNKIKKEGLQGYIYPTDHN